MTNKFKITGKLALTIFAVVVFTSIISATGVSTPYWNSNPLKIGPGESTIISLGLQNMVGTEDVTLRANITKGNEIAAIVDKSQDYFVLLGSDNVTVNIQVTIPANAEVNKVYDVEVSFLQVSSTDQGGFFSVASAFIQRIPVLVVGEPTESVNYKPVSEKGSNSLLWIVLGLVLLLIILIVLKSRKRK
jgi:hypothetical protein